MPRPCQNTDALTVIDGHSGDVHKRGDLEPSRYQCRPNKPNKEEIVAIGVNRRLTVTSSRAATLWAALA